MKIGPGFGLAEGAEIGALMIASAERAAAPGGAHPRDEWVDVTQFGDVAPRFLLAVDGREAEIAEARDLYLHDRIDIEEFERRVGAALGVKA